MLTAIICGLCSCGEAAPVKTETTEAVSETTVPAETDRAEIKDDLPKADYDGYTFKIIGREDNFVYTSELGATEQNGDIVNDASYTRNRKVEERCNINIEGTFKSNTEVTSAVRSAVLAGEDAYDLVVNASFVITSLATENLLVDWYDINHVDFTQPWWSSDAISELSVANHSYFAIGDLTMSNIGIMMCVFYNRTLGEEYSLGNIYEVVNSGKWTIDYFKGIVKNIHEDLNGDSVMDSNDFYGFGNNIGSTLQPFVFSLGARFSEKNSDDVSVLSMNNEKFIKVFEEIYSLHMENDGVIADSDYRVPRTMFANRQIIFNTGAVYHSATLYRDMEDTIGILPFPKADENMEKYYTCHDPNVSLLGVPVTASDTDRTGYIVEALAAESYRVLTPAFY